MTTRLGVTGAAFLTAAGAVLVGVMADQPATAAALHDVRINEVTSSGDDTVELYNAGTSAVSITGWKYVDGDSSHSKKSLPSTSVPAGGYVTFNSSIGLGDADSFNLYDAGGALADSVTWPTDGAKPSIQRCANGTGSFQRSTTATFGGANSCPDPGTGTLTGGGGSLTSGCTPEAPAGSGSAPSGASTWPGGPDVAIVDNVCAFQTSTGPEGRDVSGLAFSADGTTLWAVKNKNWLYKLVRSGGTWVADSSWSSTGKQIRFAGGSGEPDSEGITVGGDGHLYITSERDNTANTKPKDTVMEFDPAASGSTLTPLRQWDMTSQFPQLDTGSKDDANLGFEGVAYVPDSWLTANGWKDLRTGATYDPADYPGHGSGLFFAGLEDDGKLYVYALHADGTLTTFGPVATGAASVMDVVFDAGSQRIVATCDNTCAVSHTFLKITSGAIVKDAAYTKPTVVPTDNLEGFALAPTSTCSGGTREAVWSDDGIYGSGPGSQGYGHALYSGTFPC
ncbi:lamin tail domain-containing protein [Nocardioides sp. NPDC126508]